MNWTCPNCGAICTSMYSGERGERCGVEQLRHHRAAMADDNQDYIVAMRMYDEARRLIEEATIAFKRHLKEINCLD